jgi:hypothetical protein
VGFSESQIAQLRCDITKAIGSVDIAGLHGGLNAVDYDGYISPHALFNDGYLYPKLLPDVEAWCDENIRHDYAIRSIRGYPDPKNVVDQKDVIYFFDVMDLVHFKLRWIG